MPTVALQIIRTTWTKQSRGGNGARLRNAVPLAFPVNSGMGKFSAGIYRFDESNDFVAPTKPPLRAQNSETRELHQSFIYDYAQVSCTWDHESQKLNLNYSNANGGAPKTVLFDEFGNQKPLQRGYVVEANTWNHLRWMERFSDFDTGNWWYEHTVVNLAYFAGAIDVDVFLNSEPTNQFVSLPILR